MLEEEIFVAPALVRGVALGAAERCAQRARGAVPVQHVLVEGIERSQVEAAAEPPGHGLPFALGAEMAHVGVGGGQIRIARMQDQRHAHRAPGRARQFPAAPRWPRAAAGCRRRPKIRRRPARTPRRRAGSGCAHRRPRTGQWRVRQEAGCDRRPGTGQCRGRQEAGSDRRLRRESSGLRRSARHRPPVRRRCRCGPADRSDNRGRR